jgi:predicted flap endonuclease-1-like 5' DNA nuclease
LFSIKTLNHKSIKKIMGIPFNMSAAAIFAGFFIVLAAITFLIPALPPAQLLYEALNIPQSTQSVSGISVAILFYCVTNGFIWGIFAAAVYSLSNYLYRRKSLAPMPAPQEVPVTSPEPKPLDWRVDRYPPALTIRKKRGRTEQEIETIEGIGAVRGRMLRNAGIGTVDDLLRAGATRLERQRLANEFGVSYSTISKWVHRADLLRIRGIGSQYSELLEAAGVRTVTYLSTRDPWALWQKLRAVNRRRKLVRRIPPLKTVEKWVYKARDLKPLVE